MWRWLRGLIEPQREATEAAASAQTGPRATGARSSEAFYYGVARARLDGQTAQIAAIDSKASAMFTIGSTVLPITASLLATEQDVIANCVVSKVALFAGSGFYVALVAAFVWASRLTRWDERPELEQWREITVGSPEPELQRWLGDACVEAYLSNAPQLARKAALVGAALWFLAGEAVSLTVAVLAPLW